MERRDLELLVAVAESGSLSAAAGRLGVAQPALSRRLGALERTHGLRLFDRSSRGAVPTPAGGAVVEAARRALSALAEVEAAARDAAAGSLGLLRVGTTPTLGADVLPEALARHRHAHPRVRVELAASGDSTSLRAGLLRGELDVALCVLRDPPEEGLAVVGSARQAFVVVLREEDPLAAGERISREQLRGVSFVALARGEGLREILDDLAAAVGGGTAVGLETTEREMLIPLVAAGLGVTVVPAEFARHRHHAGVAVRPLAPPLDRPVGLVVRTDADPLAVGFAQVAVPVLEAASPVAP